MPKVVLNALIALSAVHMATRHLGNAQFCKLALETKAGAYRSFNEMLQNPSTRVSDLTYCCVMLVFAADVSRCS